MADAPEVDSKQVVPDHRPATTADLAPILARLDALEAKPGKKAAAKKEGSK